LLQAEFIEQKEKTDVVQVETIDQLGIVARLVDKLKLVERIDARVPISKTHGAIVTHGQRIKAMIINGLGFNQNPIYLSPTFFEGKDVCALTGEGIEAQHLNDYVHGRTLDAIYKYGTTALLAEMANEISQEFIPATGRQNGHQDTTSLRGQRVKGSKGSSHLYNKTLNIYPNPLDLQLGCKSAQHHDLRWYLSMSAFIFKCVYLCSSVVKTVCLNNKLSLPKPSVFQLENHLGISSLGIGLAML
jgi:hypothetical protein